VISLHPTHPLTKSINFCDIMAYIFFSFALSSMILLTRVPWLFCKER
jgi:hypothetical protein